MTHIFKVLFLKVYLLLFIVRESLIFLFRIREVENVGKTEKKTGVKIVKTDIKTGVGIEKKDTKIRKRDIKIGSTEIKIGTGRGSVKEDTSQGELG